MIMFRFFLVAVFVSMSIYTGVVIDQHGIGLFGVFFGDMAKFGWAGQFNADFMAMLAMSAIWVAWRSNFSTFGFLLATVAFFGGAPFLCVYLLVLSFSCSGNVVSMLIGDKLDLAKKEL
jgi:hypothetical protein